MSLSKSYLKVSLIALVVTVIALTPGNSKLLFGYGDTAGQFHKFVCENTTPLKVVFYEPNHPALPKTTVKGEVILNWLKLKENADKYTIAYGVQPGNYIYGVTDTGNVNSFTVRYLNPGTRYYFIVRGVNGCMPGPWSQEWSAVAPGGSGVGGNVVLTGNAGGTTGGNPLPGNTGTKLTSPRPTTNPSVKPSTVPGTGGSQDTRGNARVGGFQGLLNWFRGLFK